MRLYYRLINHHQTEYTIIETAKLNNIVLGKGSPH